MSQRFTNTQPSLSKRSQLQSQPSRLKPGHTGKVNFRQTNRNLLEQNPISSLARRTAYDKITKIQKIVDSQLKENTSYEEIIRQVKNIIGTEVEINMGCIFPGEARTQVGRAILSNGNFYLQFSRIMCACPHIVIKSYLKDIKDKYLSQITENKALFEKFIENQEQKLKKKAQDLHQDVINRLAERSSQQNQMKKSFQKIKVQYSTQKLKGRQQSQFSQKSLKQITENPFEQSECSQNTQINQPILELNQIRQNRFKQFGIGTSNKKQERKSILKPSRLSPKSLHKTVRWSQVSECQESIYMNEIIVANKQYAYKQKKQQAEKQLQQKLKKVKQDNSFLLDFFKIKDPFIYDISQVDVTGTIAQIDNKLAIVLIKEKLTTPEPSYVKTRSTYELDKERKKQEKQVAQIIAIGLINKVEVAQFNLDCLRKIEKDYKIKAFVLFDDFSTHFMKSLPEDSVDDDKKKINKN